MSAVDFIRQEFLEKLTNENYKKSFDELIQQAKEQEQKEKDEFAIGFAQWCDENYNTLKPYDMKQLLEIYKKEKGL
jgi:hypothetical protein